jgi:hypothetical protein
VGRPSAGSTTRVDAVVPRVAAGPRCEASTDLALPCRICVLALVVLAVCKLVRNGGSWFRWPRVQCGGGRIRLWRVAVCHTRQGVPWFLCTAGGNGRRHSFAAAAAASAALRLLRQPACRCPLEGFAQRPGRWRRQRLHAFTWSPGLPTCWRASWAKASTTLMPVGATSPW